jgi:predicted enzyme related to lactoylglutathione lyase
MEVKGIHWMGICAVDWNSTVGFYRDVLGLAVREEGTQAGSADGGVPFTELAAANGDFLEVFGGNLGERELFKAPVVGFLVEDVGAARAEMEARGAVFLGPVGRGGSWEWSYFRSPEGHVHQLMAELRGRRPPRLRRKRPASGAPPRATRPRRHKDS